MVSLLPIRGNDAGLLRLPEAFELYLLGVVNDAHGAVLLLAFADFVLRRKNKKAVLRAMWLLGIQGSGPLPLRGRRQLVI